MRLAWMGGIISQPATPDGNGCRIRLIRVTPHWGGRFYSAEGGVWVHVDMTRSPGHWGEVRKWVVQ